MICPFNYRIVLRKDYNAFVENFRLIISFYPVHIILRISKDFRETDDNCFEKLCNLVLKQS